ncbi:GH92 family glycosyl hydrolase [Amycolatopsis suaedae]|uniref:Glycoside hydrolase family 92 protein n=1 Tax=Amycolatopsis suaedae TaxID=2510978 RepID=A0A4V2EMR1_9PSEU|nr:GH92 family glycosyl hydrolase [Amycolatopsis suaedae]RZQ65985.1 glycoside hydrolase family 92 protein [Amycolatopsis suaedae]
MSAEPVPTEFFSSFEEGDPQPGTGDRLRVHLGSGPVNAPAAKARAGFTGLRALHYGTEVTGPARTGLFQVDLTLTEHSELSYVVLPASDDGPTWRSTHVAVDLEFADGGRLSDLDVTDQYGFPLTAAGQGESKRLYLDQWNLVRCHLGIAAGRRVTAILLTTDLPEGDGEATGWLDDVRIGPRTPAGPADAVDRVRTTRGTHSSGRFSRGNTFPATAVPHGFNFWTPVTDASATNWLYSYHQHNNAANRPALQAFAVSHQPSPWMGDRHTFQLMPGTGPVVADRAARALPFGHDAETDRPHHYRVRFDNGLVAEVAPADHAAVFRFTFPEDTDRGWVLFDNARNRGGLRCDASGLVTGHTWVRSRLSAGARRMYVYGRFDRAATSAARLRTPPWRTVTGHLTFDTSTERTLTLRIATSLISLRQAQDNLEQEIPDGTGFDEVRDRARQAWQDVLGTVDVDGGTDDQLTTLYSNLYRLFLYPNSAHETVGTTVRHASPVIPTRRPSTRRRTGAKVADGPMTVNNGFWDTYRTTWPAYALLTPDTAGRLIEGFVQQYRDGGWISRWSSPGYADLMTGTSSDVAFADAYLRGVRGFDVATAYQAALRNATVTPPHKAVGRKGLDTAIFRGYTSTATGEGLSWGLEGCVNDFGMANLAEALRDETDSGDPMHGEYTAHARYFHNRALHYVHHFDRRSGFFVGRNPDGTWRAEPGHYDPTAWGGDYTETNGWNTAFSAPHDGAGLAALHGGRKHLATALDTFFDTPETGAHRGSYSGIIHEMTEARDVRMGQYGHSNQPSHHIPWMYLHAGAPAKAQRIVREVLTRLYLGSELGQGYPGDEDNGEMSAWWLFAAIGLYPLAVGSPHYVLGAPLFPRVTIRLPGDKQLVINAPSAAAKPYVHGLRVNGTPHTGTTIGHDVLAAGAVLDFELGTEPSDWGTDEADLPPSLTAHGQLPQPLTDLTGHGRSQDNDPAHLFDDTTRTQVNFRSPTPIVEFTVDGPVRPVEMYTLTSGLGPGDPVSWVIEGSDDGTSWQPLDERTGQTFPWRRQTRPFLLPEPAAHRHYRLRITGGTRNAISLAQWELLARQDGAS